MTTQSIRLKVSRVSVLKAKIDVRFPANVSASQFLTVTKASGAYTFGVDYTLIANTPINDAASSYLVVYDQAAGVYKRQSVATLLQFAPYVDQNITGPGPVTLAGNVGTVRVNQAVGAAITINLPAAANKTCPVSIADWKGDAGTNNITIVPNGTEKIQGLSSWTIAADNGSVFLRPIAGVGYII